MVPARDPASAQHTGRPRALGMLGTWAWWLGVVGAGAGYAWARALFTHEYSAVPWRRLLALDAPLPFGHRVLIPWLARPVVEAGVSAGWVFGVVEALAFVVVVGFTAAALTRWLPQRRARAGAAWLAATLPLVYILPRPWPLQYPWDGPALAVLAVGLWAASQRRYGVALGVAAVGAANRETAVLVALVVLAVHAADPRERPIAWAWAQLIVAATLAVRLVVAVALPDNPGPSIHWTIGPGEYRVMSNLRWLSAPRHWPWLCVYLGVLPLAWPLVRRTMPGALHRVALVGLAFFVAAMAVANVYEPRAWGESVYLVAAAVVVGALRRRSVSGPDVGEPSVSGPRWLARLDRFAPLVIVVAFALFVAALATWRFLPVAQWPMPR